MSAEIPSTARSGAIRQRIHLVIGGHVDHGKSTVIGRLLADAGALPQGKLEQVREQCARTSRPFEYAFLLDALKDERAQGITIDAARVFFRQGDREYVILDAPGHIEFLRNMITGASHAEAALLVIDAGEGIQENSRRHGYLMAMLGITQLAVIVNKMDLVGYRQQPFQKLVDEYARFLEEIGVEPIAFIPVAAREGDNVAAKGNHLDWYEGPTVLEMLKRFEPEPPPVDRPFRMPVQDVYKFTEHGDDRRIVAGTVDAGSISVGDEVVFYPSGKKSRINSIEAFNGALRARASAGQATGFTLTDQIYVRRGELAARAGERRPSVTTRLRVSLFWLGHEPLVQGRDYILKLGSARVLARIDSIQRLIDASSLATLPRHDRVEQHEVAECTLELQHAIAFDEPATVPGTSRFVLVDDYDIRGGGIVREALPDKQAWVRDKVLLRNFKWEPSFIPTEQRAERYGQHRALLLLTGPREADRKRLAKELELRLFNDGRVVYFLGMGNMVYGVDADLDRRGNRAEHMRRLAEVANIMLDAGVILLVSAQELGAEDVDLIKASVGADLVTAAWLGGKVTTDLRPDLQIDEGEP
ncbi:MAG TPA: GTP-binding protein, partial [Gemmatimonadales bacterium]|nr:GTP-binding protein [Gemmatimonadales bacterium]